MRPFSEYRKMMKLIETEEYSKDDLYKELLQKEDNVLKTLNRLADQSIQENNANYLTMNIETHMIKFFEHWTYIVHEVVLMASGQKRFTLKNIIDVFFDRERSLYVGVMLVLNSFILFLFYSSM